MTEPPTPPPADDAPDADPSPADAPPERPTEGPPPGHLTFVLRDAPDPPESASLADRFDGVGFAGSQAVVREGADVATDAEDGAGAPEGTWAATVTTTSPDGGEGEGPVTFLLLGRPRPLRAKPVLGAVAQAWHWEDAPAAVSGHRSFVIIQLVGRLPEGGDPGEPSATEMQRAGAESSIEPLERLRLLARAAAAVCQLPGARAWLHLGGGVIHPPSTLEERLPRLDDLGYTVDLWTNVRMFEVEGGEPDRVFLDTLGLDQLELPDIEVVVPAGEDPEPRARLLRNVSIYLAKEGPVLEEGHTVEIPGVEGLWKVEGRDAPAVPPSREVIRLGPAAERAEGDA